MITNNSVSYDSTNNKDLVVDTTSTVKIDRINEIVRDLKSSCFGISNFLGDTILLTHQHKPISSDNTNKQNYEDGVIDLLGLDYSNITATAAAEKENDCSSCFAKQDYDLGKATQVDDGHSRCFNTRQMRFDSSASFNLNEISSFFQAYCDTSAPASDEKKSVEASENEDNESEKLQQALSTAQEEENTNFDVKNLPKSSLVDPFDCGEDERDSPEQYNSIGKNYKNNPRLLEPYYPQQKDSFVVLDLSVQHAIPDFVIEQKHELGSGEVQRHMFLDRTENAAFRKSRKPRGPARHNVTHDPKREERLRRQRIANTKMKEKKETNEQKWILEFNFLMNENRILHEKIKKENEYIKSMKEFINKRSKKHKK